MKRKVNFFFLLVLRAPGKPEARAGRKMGHLTALGDTVEEAQARVVRARSVLRRG